MTEFNDKQYYLGIIFDTTAGILSYSINQYICDFLDSQNEKHYEYLVKIIDKEKDENIDNRLSYKLEIVKIITQQDNINQVGSIIWIYDDNDSYLEPDAKITHNPECEINDGGVINCSGCYKSLFIDYENYNKSKKTSYVLIENHHVLIEFKTWIHDGKILEKKICNIILDESDDYEECSSDSEEEYESESSYYLVKKCRTFGYIKNNKFIKINDSENKIGFFLSFYLK